MGLGDFISGIFGSENKERAPDVQVDPLAYQYGGRYGGADAAAGRMEGLANGSYGVGAGYQNNSYGLAGLGSGYLGQSDAARAQQQQALGLMMGRATGQTPSIAQMQADRQMQQAVAAQGARAASARGPAALALAQQQAANNTANAQGAISNQAQINAAQERQAAEQAAFGAASGIRQGDLGSAGTAYGASAQQGQLGIGYGQLGLGQDSLANNIRQSQLGASMNQQAQTAANRLGSAGINAGVGGQNAAMNQSNSMGLMGLISQGAGAAAGAFGGKADGGPVAAGKPYVVGERGPEVVVPTDNAVVVPNEIAFGGDEPMAASTWGAAPADSDAQRFDTQRRETALAALDALGREFGPGGRYETTDMRRVREFKERARQDPGSITDAERDAAKESYDRIRQARARAPEMAERNAVAEGRALPSPGGGLARMRIEQPKDDEEASLFAAPKGSGQPAKEAAPAGPQTLKQRGLAALGNASGQFMQMAANVDTRYHGPSGYIPPQLLPVVGARAYGGPMSGGLPYLVGEQGPELVVPAPAPPSAFAGLAPRTSLAAGSGPAAASFDRINPDGSMDVLGSLKAHSDFATRFARNPSSGGM